MLDLAFGTSALLARLRDQGFTDLHATELDVEKFGPLPGVTPRAVDLNSNYVGEFGRRFNLVIAVEIIEHLEYPRQFLRNIRDLLEDGGYLLLSTPNVSDWVSRLKFLVKGELRYFDEWHYKRNGHISPITDVQLRLLLSEVEFRLLGHTTAGTFFGPLKRVVTAPLRWAFRLFGRQTAGDVNIYLVAKDDVRVTAEQRNEIYYLKNKPRAARIATGARVRRGKPYVQTPVVLSIFNRPDVTARVFAAIPRPARRACSSSPTAPARPPRRGGAGARPRSPRPSPGRAT